MANKSKFKVRVKKQPEAAIKRINEIAKQMRGEGSVVVGLPKGANNYPDGTSVVMVGAVHEFGSPANNVPERSFLRSTVTANRSKYKRLSRKLIRLVAQGKLTTAKALAIMGQTLQTDVRAKITTIDSPPLKSRQGNPLVKTGHLRQSVVFEVKE